MGDLLRAEGAVAGAVRAWAQADGLAVLALSLVLYGFSAVDGGSSLCFCWRRARRCSAIW